MNRRIKMKRMKQELELLRNRPVQVLNEFIEYIRPYINISVVDDNYTVEDAVRYRAELDILV